MTPETSRGKNLNSIAEFRLFDDTFMSAAFDGQKEATKFLIDTITGLNVTVKDTKAQYFLSNTRGHEVRLDIVATDRSGKVYHFEVQRAKAGASEKRARFLSALLDSTLLGKGEDYSSIPDRYTIFITESDYFGAGLPLYHIGNMIEELNRPFADGAHTIYVNGEFRDISNPIGTLMHDFSCIEPSDMIIPVLKERVTTLKKTTGGHDTMCAIMDNLIKDSIKEEKFDLAEEKIASGKYSLETISDILGLPLSDVQSIAEKMKKEAKAE